MSDNVVFKSKTDTDDRNSSSEKLGESVENILSAEQKDLSGGASLMRELLHGMSAVIHMWFFCWFGSNVTTQSGDVFLAAYESNWYDKSPQIKNSLRMIITRAGRPVKVKAGLIGAIDLPLFATIVRTAYSYLTLLIQMNEF
ncbi:odorant receptor 94a-like [Zootermopsis nevadensis]|uniref:odorant receptor 94a-like n=1 Tax=Zootermopsis nevadensis TaxID=136037 RepID=UPI000B8E8825|nr:odorant receptor 94a-like [Zootermopsis nevadensis]